MQVKRIDALDMENIIVLGKDDAFVGSKGMRSIFWSCCTMDQRNSAVSKSAAKESKWWLRTGQADVKVTNHYFNPSQSGD